MQKAACDLLLDLTDNDAVIVPKLVARDLGVTIDSYLQMTEHVNNICRSAYLAIRNIGKIWKHCEIFIHAFITCKLDSCNSILYWLTGM